MGVLLIIFKCLLKIERELFLIMSNTPFSYDTSSSCSKIRIDRNLDDPEAPLKTKFPEKILEYRDQKTKKSSSSSSSCCCPPTCCLCPISLTCLKNFFTCSYFRISTFKSCLKTNKCFKLETYKFRKLRREFKNISMAIYWLQTFGYLLVTVIEKLAVFHITQAPQLQRFFGELRVLLTQLVPIKDLEVALVLFVIPFILNCLMFWVVDNILMKGMGCLTVFSLKISKYSYLLVRNSVVGLWKAGSNCVSSSDESRKSRTAQSGKNTKLSPLSKSLSKNSNGNSSSCQKC